MSGIVDLIRLSFSYQLAPKLHIWPIN